jgi:acyl-CoA reductase-like NAD-dependent aldehyde dehydrogenase
LTSDPIRSEAEVERALASAYAARRACADVATGKRAAELRAIAAGIAALSETFATTIVEEVQKPIDLARGEVARAVATFEAAADAVAADVGERLPLDLPPNFPPKTAIVRRVPAGVVAAITPFNFPLNLVAHKVAPAIAAGCPIVLKPAPSAPKTAFLLRDVVERAGRPKGGFVVAALEDDALAAPLIEDRRVRVLTFTGSAAVGWALRDRAKGKVVGLELGGDAFAIVHEDADLPHAAARCAFGAFAYAGQVCISVQHVLVHRSRRDAFVAALVAATDALKIGDPRDGGVVVGPMLRDRDADRVDAWIAEARAAGARIVRDVGRDERLVGPKILEDVPPTCRLGREEVFGPTVDVAAYDRLDEAIARVNASENGLQAGVFTRDLDVVRRLDRELEVGALVVDDAPTFRVDAMPYGGVKGSGLGREGPRYALELMTERKTLIL